MPLGETARKYAEVVFEKKIQDLSREYDWEASKLKATIVNQGGLQKHLTSLQISMPARQVKARADALQAAYEKDHDVLDADALEEIMSELEELAQTTTRAFVSLRQGEADAKAQRTGTVDLDLSPKLRELSGSKDKRMHDTLSEIRSSLQAKVYEGQLNSQPAQKRKSPTVRSANEWHTEIENVSRQLFNDGHYREAVLNSYIRVIEAVKQKSEIADDGDGLMGRAFGCEIGRLPRVQFNPCQTQADIDEQRGIMFLFKGIVGMRNSKAHAIRLFNDEQRAREYLALSSLLMRLLDIATVNP